MQQPGDCDSVNLALGFTQPARAAAARTNGSLLRATTLVDEEGDDALHGAGVAAAAEQQDSSSVGPGRHRSPVCLPKPVTGCFCKTDTLHD